MSYTGNLPAAALDDDLFGFALVDSPNASASGSTAAASTAVTLANSDRGETRRSKPAKNKLGFYAVTRVPESNEFLVPGVWCCRWSCLSTLLPNHKLFGNGVSLQKVRLHRGRGFPYSDVVASEID